MSDYISRAKAIEEINKYHMTSGVTNQGTWNECVDVITHTVAEMPSADAISIDQANAMIKSYVSHYEENKCFDGRTNREIISEFVERDDTFAIMVDEVNGTVNIELSLDFWNAPYKEGE